MNSAASLCPKLAKVGIKSTVCGPESFTPDHKPLLGEDPNVFGRFELEKHLLCKLLHDNDNVTLHCRTLPQLRL